MAILWLYCILHRKETLLAWTCICCNIFQLISGTKAVKQIQAIRGESTFKKQFTLLNTPNLRQGHTYACPLVPKSCKLQQCFRYIVTSACINYKGIDFHTWKRLLWYSLFHDQHSAVNSPLVSAKYWFIRCRSCQGKKTLFNAALHRPSPLKRGWWINCAKIRNRKRTLFVYVRFAECFLYH